MVHPNPRLWAPLECLEHLPPHLPPPHRAFRLSQLAEHDIVTYSYGDADGLYLRGQWTVHRNEPRVNGVWRECANLGAGLERELQVESQPPTPAQPGPDPDPAATRLQARLQTQPSAQP